MWSVGQWVGQTYVHVQLLAITLGAVGNGGDDDELVLHDEVADASLFAGRLVAGVGFDVELEGGNGGQADEEEQAAQGSEQHLHGGRIGRAASGGKEVRAVVHTQKATRCFARWRSLSLEHQPRPVRPSVPSHGWRSNVLPPLPVSAASMCTPVPHLLHQHLEKAPLDLRSWFMYLAEKHRRF